MNEVLVGSHSPNQDRCEKFRVKIIDTVLRWPRICKCVLGIMNMCNEGWDASSGREEGFDCIEVSSSTRCTI